MEVISILNTLWARKRWVALALVIALAVGIATAYRVSLSPPALQSKSFDVASATTQVLLDSPQGSLVGIDQDITRLAVRASIFATFMRSGSLTTKIAERAGIPPQMLTSDGPYTGPGDPNQGEPNAEKRAEQLVSEGMLYRLRFDSGRSEKPLPLLTIFAQAPTVEEAERLADAGAAELKHYVDTQAEANDVPVEGRLVVQQIQRADGGIVTRSITKKAVAITSVVVFLGLLLLVVVISGVIENYRFERLVRRELDMPGMLPVNGNGNGKPHGPARAPERVGADQNT